MGKGANYVNQNKGVHLQASKKKNKSQKNNQQDSMPMCEYGAGCTRPKCIYRHPTERDPSYYQQGKEPCMAFLAGVCAFDAKGCRKRHPPKAEKEALIARYKRTKCRFGDDCQTRACLYQHPSDEPEEPSQQQGPPQPLMAAWGPPLQAAGAAAGGGGSVGPNYDMPPLHQAYYHSHQQQLYQRQQQQQHVPFPQQQQQFPMTGVGVPPPQPMAYPQHPHAVAATQAPPPQSSPPQQQKPNANAAEFVPGKPYVPSASAPAFVPGSQWKSSSTT